MSPSACREHLVAEQKCQVKNTNSSIRNVLGSILFSNCWVRNTYMAKIEILLKAFCLKLKYFDFKLNAELNLC